MCMLSSPSIDDRYPPLANFAGILDPSPQRPRHNWETVSRVEISPPDAVRRLAKTWPGMAAELVQASSDGRTEYRFRGPVHLLVVFEGASRHDGESFVEGLPRSALRNLSRKLTFVPAGHAYHERLHPRAPARLMYIYIDPAMLDLYAGPSMSATPLAPRLLFEDAALWESALKLKRSIADTAQESWRYSDAVGTVL